MYGVFIPNWDYSLKLMFSISLIGGEDVQKAQDLEFLNQGSKKLCSTPIFAHSDYCDFEKFFKKDEKSYEKELFLDFKVFSGEGYQKLSFV